jgi:hypothetical protein
MNLADDSFDLRIYQGWRSCVSVYGKWTAAMNCQNSRWGISINWIWSHHQFETEPFSACMPANGVDLIFCGFLLRTKHPAGTNGSCPIRPIAGKQSSAAGQTRRPTFFTE